MKALGQTDFRFEFSASLIILHRIELVKCYFYDFCEFYISFAIKTLEKVPEAFKSCFDTAKSKISKHAADPAKNDGFTKQKHIHGDKTLNKYSFGPNVVYYLLTTERYNDKSKKRKNNDLVRPSSISGL